MLHGLQTSSMDGMMRGRKKKLDGMPHGQNKVLIGETCNLCLLAAIAFMGNVYVRDGWPAGSRVELHIMGRRAAF